MTFSEKLKNKREEAGLERKDLATKSGIAASVIRDYEQGHRSNPSFNTVQKLATALGCTCHDLADDPVDEEPAGD
jgi:transcriptional regulator with XRE-family HTH domain